MPAGPVCRETVAEPMGAERREETASSCDVRAEVCETEEVIFVVDSGGRVVHVKTSRGPLPPDQRRCILDALAGVCFTDVGDKFVHHLLYGPCD